jgi:hypothetical protein
MTYFVNIDYEILSNPLSSGIDFLHKRIEERRLEG